MGKYKQGKPYFYIFDVVGAKRLLQKTHDSRQF